MTDLVRIQRRVSKKHYLNTKRTYEYERLSLDIPKKLHEIIRPLLKREFRIDIKLEDNSAVLILTPTESIKGTSSNCRKREQPKSINS